jgi:hypothetical protein
VGLVEPVQAEEVKTLLEIHPTNQWLA